MLPPSYFHAVRAESAGRWKTLEADPTLAAPWHQLFSQVQSPRHVVSELLQNADDAGATEISVYLDEARFAFTHNGADFESDQFQSLCRFGFSNKRTLHTIGFRGIGFKSVFSLGSRVRVSTPSLRVWFDRKRFTLPEWDESIVSPDNSCTEISVDINDEHRRRELSKNLDEWKASPTSLLFFRNINKVVVNGFTLERRSVGPGPVPYSTWIDLHGQQVTRVLHIHSSEMAFPDDAILEISRERMTDQVDLPPCRVEIVLGLSGDQRLFVVLPTAVRPMLPFSCNAPFVQDPARMAIKDPSVSPTNRWLTERIGTLAADAMLAWLGNHDLPMATRAQAYRLLCPTEVRYETVAASVTSSVIQAFATRIESCPVLLTTTGDLRLPMDAIAVPERLHRIWDPVDIARLFGDGDSSGVLAAEVSNKACSHLFGWGWIKPVTQSEILDVARSTTLPRPKSKSGIAEWWMFVDESSKGHYYRNVDRSIPLIPVDNEECLFASNEVVRLPEKPQALRPEDWDKLIARCKAIDSEWISTVAVGEGTAGLTSEHAQRILADHGLDKPTSLPDLVGKCFDDLLQEDDDIPVDSLVWFAHVLAALNVPVPPNFEFVTKDFYRYSLDHDMLVDDPKLDCLAPDEWLASRVLHDDYSIATPTCSQQKWLQWVKSEKSGLASFSPLKPTEIRFFSRDSLARFCEMRGAEPPQTFQLRQSSFVVNDIDFDESLLRYWTDAIRNGEITWRDILIGMMGDSSRSWESSLYASPVELGTSKSYPMYGLKVPAGWITSLRDKQCLPDTRGQLRVPAEMLRRTPDTEPFMNVEPFIDAELDIARNTQLLDLLGVRSSPAGPRSVVDRLRSLSEADNPPLQEVRKWYDAIDRMLYRHRPEDLHELREAFATESLIWSEDHGWLCSSEVFRTRGADDPDGFPVIHSSFSDLAMWRQLGVEDSPTPVLLLQYVEEWEAGRRLSARDLATVRSIMPIYASKLWNEVGRWLTLDGLWTPTRQIEYVLFSDSGVRARELTPAIKRKTADCQGLPDSIRAVSALSSLSDLAISIELRRTRTQADLPEPVSKGWMRALGSALGRIVLASPEEQSRVRQVGIRFATTQWQSFSVLEITPYLDGTPAGQAQEPDALWEGGVLFVRQVSPAKAMDAVVAEVCRQLPGDAYSRLLRSCYERDESFVTDYVSEQIELAKVLDVPVLLPSVVTPPKAQAGTPDQDAEPSSPTSMQPGASPSGEDLVTTARLTNQPLQQPVGQDLSRAADDATPAEDDEELADATDDAADLARKTPEREKRNSDENPPFIARYATENNFRWNPREKAYTRADGMRLCKSQPPFHWEFWDQIRMRCRYVVCEQSLVDSGVEIASEAWELIRKYPGSTGLIVRGEDGRPTPVSGTDLVRMVQGEALTLFPFKYRLRKT